MSTNSNAPRVRFAPSPTGDLHLGGVRTALFNWLFARHEGGTFLLRIEDSDEERSTQEACDLIIEGMQWLGLSPDEPIIYQSNRRARHLEVLEQLIKEGHAYYCDCPPEMLAEKRERAIKEGKKPKYDGRCRDRGLAPGNKALRFRVPEEGEVAFDDIIRGHVVFSHDELDDLIICRSNGTPTYNFLVVVDDHDMEITHVIRGEDHINNTPRQILMYRAMGFEPPVFAHLPSVLGPDKSRLSKRHGATSVLRYRDMGFLPEGLINYIARLGWGHGDQEIFSREELILYFDLHAVNKAPAVFDAEKLKWVNAQHLKMINSTILSQSLIPFLKRRGYQQPYSYPPEKLVKMFRERCQTLDEIAEKAAFIFSDPDEYDARGVKKFLRPVMIEHFQRLMEFFAQLDSFTSEKIEKVIQDYITRHEMKLGKIAQPLRVAVTGGTASPGIYDVLEGVGKEAVLRRMERALAMMEARRQN